MILIIYFHLNDRAFLPLSASRRHRLETKNCASSWM
jgi:hypothetical protein